MLFGGGTALICRLGVSGPLAGGFVPLPCYAFWLAVIARLMPVAGVTLKDVRIRSGGLGAPTPRAAC